MTSGTRRAGLCAGAVTGVFALVSLGAGPANAVQTPHTEPMDTSISAEVEIPVTGGLFGKVQAATSLEEKRAILEEAGFVERTPGLYAQSVEGFTAEYRFEAAPRPKGVLQPDWRVTWETLLPGLWGTVDQWKAAANGAAPIAGFACSAITVWWGAGACAAAVTYALMYINAQDLAGDYCVGYIGLPGTGHVAARRPGNC
jgi:hypothetical protein